MSNIEGVIMVSNARLSFPSLAEPQITKKDDGTQRISYNCELIVPQDHPGFKQFYERYTQLAQAQWKGQAQAVMQMIQGERKLRCYGAGQEKIKQETMQPYDGYVGNLYISTGSKNPPQAIQANGTPVDKADTMAYQMVMRGLYGGCRVNAAIRPWLQENKYGRGVRCDLIAIQFAGDDKPFGAGVTDASAMFGATASPNGAAAPASAAPDFGTPGVPSFMS